MGIPIQTPMGATGGAGIFTAIDNGVELTAIATAITLQTVEMERLRFTIAALVNAVNKIADASDATSKSLSDINSSVGGVNVAMHDATTTAQTLAASQIQKNNFDIAVTKQGYEKLGETPPKMPTIIEQIKQSVSDSTVIHAQVKAQNLIAGKIEDAVTQIQSWITGSAVYQDVAKWIKQKKDAVVASILPAGPKAIAINTAAQAGTPLPPNI
jgi:hypothetical protein